MFVQSTLAGLPCNGNSGKDLGISKTVFLVMKCLGLCNFNHFSVSLSGKMVYPGNIRPQKEVQDLKVSMWRTSLQQIS